MRSNNTCNQRPFKKIITLIFYISLSLLLYTLLIHFTRFYYNKPFFTPFAYRLNKSDIILKQGECFKLYMAGINKRISFSSSDFKVAEVSIFGQVTAQKPGTAIITVEAKEHVAKCRVHVVDLNYSSLTLKIGESKRLKIQGFNTKVKWKSSNKSIVSVKNGKVTAKKTGKAKITATIKDKKLTCVVIVR